MSILSGLLTIDSRNQAFVQQIWANCVLNRKPNQKPNWKPNQKPNQKPKIEICCSTLEYATLSNLSRESQILLILSG